MILIIDNSGGSESSYVPKLLELLDQYNYKYLTISTVKELNDLKDSINILILSASAPVTSDSNYKNVENIELNKMALEKYRDIPILGICFGCQFLNVYFGGTLKKLKEVYCDDTLVYFKNKKELEMHYCLRFVIEKVADDFRILGTSKINGEEVPTFIAHKKKAIYGMLFHPEYLESTHFFLINLIDSLL